LGQHPSALPIQRLRQRVDQRDANCEFLRALDSTLAANSTRVCPSSSTKRSLRTGGPATMRSISSRQEAINEARGRIGEDRWPVLWEDQKAWVRSYATASGTAAAFDCANATLPSSLVICSDPELTGLADERVAPKEKRRRSTSQCLRAPAQEGNTENVSSQGRLSLTVYLAQQAVFRAPRQDRAFPP
jgi:hypothetical protein